MINPNASQLDGQQRIQNVPDNPHNPNGIEKKPKSTFENAVETFKRNTAKSMSDVKETHYRAVSEGTQGQGFLGGLWQGIKNIAHNIKAFMSSPMTSAFNIAHEAETLVKTMNTVKHREELIEAFKKNPDEATQMLSKLTEQFGDIAVLKKEGNHNGDCGKLLDCTMSFLGSAVEVIKQCREDAEIVRQEQRIYDANSKLKDFLEGSRNMLKEVNAKLTEALQNDPKATLPGTKQLLPEAELALKTYNMRLENNLELLNSFKNNSVVRQIQSENARTTKNIVDTIGKFGQ